MKNGRVILNILTGVSLGLLIGLLIGLSLSPVVGSAAALLVAAAVVFMGLSEKPSGDHGAESNATLLRILFLSIFCMIGIGLGVRARATNFLALSPMQELSNLEELGYSKEDALEILKGTLSSEERIKAGGGGLYAQKNKTKRPSELDPDSFSSVENALDAYAAFGGAAAEAASLVRKYARKGEDREILLRFQWDLLMNE